MPVDVVADADGEVRRAAGVRQALEHGPRHARRELLRAEPVAAADDPRAAAARAGSPSASAPTTFRYSGSPREPGSFVRSSDGDRLRRRRQRREERLHAEGEEEAHRDDPDLLAPRHQPVDGLDDRLDRAAHRDDHALGLGMAVVVEEVVGAAGRGGQHVHRRPARSPAGRRRTG